MANITLNINGMSCQHCVMSVKKALEGIDGVSSADVSVGSANIVFDEARTSKDVIIKAVQNAGYGVTG